MCHITSENQKMSSSPNAVFISSIPENPSTNATDSHADLERAGAPRHSINDHDRSETQVTDSDDGTQKSDNDRKQEASLDAWKQALHNSDEDNTSGTSPSGASGWIGRIQTRAQELCKHFEIPSTEVDFICAVDATNCSHVAVS